MFGVALHGRREPERLVRLHRPVGRNIHDAELAAGGRSCLVEDDGREIAGLFKSASVADEQS